MEEKTMAEWIAYFKNNPAEFAKVYLGIKLTRRQKRKLNKSTNNSHVGLRVEMGFYDDYARDDIKETINKTYNKREVI